MTIHLQFISLQIPLVMFIVNIFTLYRFYDITKLFQLVNVYLEF